MYPVLFKLGPIHIYTYGFFLALAFLSSIYLSAREAERLGMSRARFYDLCFYAVLGALAGSRILYILTELPTFAAHPLKIFALWEGGLIFHGGLVGAVAVAFYYMRRHSIPWRPAFDALAIGMPVGQALGRVGCFMAGCCWGAPSNLPWSVIFSNPETLCPIKEPLHPSQLYEAVLLMGVFGILYGLRTRKRFQGQLMLTYFVLAGTVRFVTEFVRSPMDYRGPIVIFNWPLTQVVALGIAVVSGLLLWWFWKASSQTQTKK
ncbi:MAG: prolipoprotein diacylglyceryl transferase [Desulfobaccales bacterium]